jgi:rRNA maturation RNase YbeY
MAHTTELTKNITLTNKTRQTAPKVPFAYLAERILPKGYSLSVVLCGEKFSRKLNLMYRNKDRSTNILSFPLNDKEGEIIIDLTRSKKELKKFNRKLDNFISFLFIHGLLHLKGFDHGSRMEKEEARLRARFNV